VNSALLAKVKAAGALKSVPDELRRFHHWLPVPLQPAHRRLIDWMERFDREETAERRLDLEKRAIEDIRRCLSLQRAAPSTRVMGGFLAEIERMYYASLDARQAALKNASVAAAADLEERLLEGLALWLRKQTLSGDTAGDTAMIAWSERLLRAWVKQRFAAAGGAAG